MRTSLLVFLTVAFWTSAILWHLTLGQTLTQRIPPEWSWSSRYIGFENYPDPETGEFSDKNQVTYYRWKLTIHSAANRPGSIILRDAYTTSDPETGQVSHSYVVFPKVDPETGLDVSEGHRKYYAVLPQNLEKTTYLLRKNYLKGVPLNFVRREIVEGLPVYLYAYGGRGEYTEFYEGTENDPGMDVPPGHEIRCAGDQFEFLIWAEPITGETVKIKESCLAGDYVFDVSSGAAVEPVLRWGAETAGVDVVRHTNAIRDRIFELRLARYTPAGLAGLGLLCAAAAAMRARGRRA